MAVMGFPFPMMPSAISTLRPGKLQARYYRTVRRCYPRCSPKCHVPSSPAASFPSDHIMAKAQETIHYRPMILIKIQYSLLHYQPRIHLSWVYSPLLLRFITLLSLKLGTFRPHIIVITSTRRLSAVVLSSQTCYRIHLDLRLGGIETINLAERPKLTDW